MIHVYIKTVEGTYVSTLDDKYKHTSFVFQDDGGYTHNFQQTHVVDIIYFTWYFPSLFFTQGGILGPIQMLFTELFAGIDSLQPHCTGDKTVTYLCWYNVCTNFTIMFLKN